MARNKKTILVVVLVVLFFVFINLYASSKATLNQAKADSIRSQWGADAKAASDMFGIPLERVLAIIGTESEGKDNAVGTSGERGLMQLTQGAWNEVSAGTSFDQAFEGRINIFAGTHYLKTLLEKYGDLDKATGYYNARLWVNRQTYLNRVKANEQFFL